MLFLIREIRDNIVVAISFVSSLFRDFVVNVLKGNEEKEG